MHNAKCIMHATLDPIHNHYVEGALEGRMTGWEEEEEEKVEKVETFCAPGDEGGRGCGCGRGRERAWFVFMASLMKIKVN